MVTSYYFLPRTILNRFYLDLVLLLSGDRNFSAGWKPQASITTITSASLKKESLGFETVSKSKELSLVGQGRWGEASFQKWELPSLNQCIS